MNFAFAVLAPAALGALSLRLLGLRWREDPIGNVAGAWACGCLAVGICTQAALEVGLPPRWWWSAPVVAAGLLAWAASRRAAAATSPMPAAPPGRGFTVFVVAGVLLCLLFAVAGSDRPCIEGDEGNIWSLKAKSLLVDWPAGFAAAQVHNLHPDYPQLNPLLQAFTYACTGAGTAAPDFVHFENRWLVQLCDVALFVAVAAACRRRLAALPAGLLASLLLFEPEFQNLCRTAYADGMVALGLVVAVDGFLRWRDTGDRRAGWLAGFGLAFALWSKNETMLYLASAGAAAVLLRVLAPRSGDRRWRDFAMLLPAALVVADTAVWNRRFGLQSDLLGANPSGKSMFALMAEQWPVRVPAMASEALAVVASPDHAHVVFALLLAGAVLQIRRVLRAGLALPVLALFGGFLGLHVVYVGSFLPLRFHLDTSYTRVTFQLLPAALVLLAALASGVVGRGPTGHTAHRP